jgi:hypothetical protein
LEVFEIGEKYKMNNMLISHVNLRKKRVKKKRKTWSLKGSKLHYFMCKNIW